MTPTTTLVGSLVLEEERREPVLVVEDKRESVLVRPPVLVVERRESVD